MSQFHNKPGEKTNKPNNQVNGVSSLDILKLSTL